MSECEDRHGRSLDSPPYEGTLRERQLWCRVDHHALLAAQARELAEARAEIEALRGRIAGPVAFALWISEQTLTVSKLRKAEVLEWLISVKHRAIRVSRGESDRSCLTTDACVLDGRHGKEWQEEARRALEAKESGGGP